MLPLLFDENFNGRIVRGLRRISPDLDTLSIPEAGLMGEDDPANCSSGQQKRDGFLFRMMSIP